MNDSENHSAELVEWRGRGGAPRPFTIHHLPFEVLGMIFTECVLGEMDPEGERISLDTMPITLSSVNAAWRHAALHTPTIWSKLAIQVIYGQDERRRAQSSPPWTEGLKKIDHARVWIERSGAALLHISVEWRGDQRRSSGAIRRMRIVHETFPDDKIQREWAEWIASLSHCLVYFHFQGPTICDFPLLRETLATLFHNPFPLLVHFRIGGRLEEIRDLHPQRVREVQMSQLSRLRTVVIGWDAGFHEQSLGHCQRLDGMDCLESLSLQTHGTFEGLLSALRFWLPASTRTSLRYLSIEHVGARSADVPENAIKLPNLIELCICGILGIFPILSQVFLLPAVSTLHIEGCRPVCATLVQPGKETVAPFLETAHFPLLRRFVLKGFTSIGVPLTKFLRTHPHLTSLGLSQLSISKTMAALSKYLRSARQPLLCPRLERLEMDYITNKGAEAALADLLLTRYRDGQLAEFYSERTKLFQRLESLMWEGKEQLPWDSPITPSEND